MACDLSRDGLEPEFKSFNRLEGRVCTTCAPRDQEKSHHNQCELAFVRWDRAARSATCTTKFLRAGETRDCRRASVNLSPRIRTASLMRARTKHGLHRGDRMCSSGCPHPN